MSPNALRTASSRRRAKGVKSSETYTADASMRFTTARNPLLRAPAHYEQPAAELLAQLAQCVVQVLPPARTRRPVQSRVQDVAGEHLTAALRRIDQCRQIAQPQIAAEPQHRGHDLGSAPMPEAGNPAPMTEL
ncbi:hypothetical protein MDOR_14030 [Mycolicibacterium doricum]|uniref:Uncharacterized protein n=1 Tax=Mycolicibacterium doricum TaxID=126673 RepID=A0A7I7VPM4_9MYCO|nr:hypothetical protein MDOR_14030 [Mycolicibacterium doricum]